MDMTGHAELDELMFHACFMLLNSNNWEIATAGFVVVVWSISV